MIGELQRNNVLFEHPFYDDPWCCHKVYSSQFLNLRIIWKSILIIPVSLDFGVLLVRPTISI